MFDLVHERIWFQQDGAPVRYAADVRFLSEKFPYRWIDRRGLVEWPPRSPDLTPLNFYLQDYRSKNIEKLD